MFTGGTIWILTHTHMELVEESIGSLRGHFPHVRLHELIGRVPNSVLKNRKAEMNIGALIEKSPAARASVDSNLTDATATRLDFGWVGVPSDCDIGN